METEEKREEGGEKTSRVEDKEKRQEEKAIKRIGSKVDEKGRRFNKQDTH